MKGQNQENMHLLINHHFEDDMKRVLRKDILDVGYPAGDIDPDNVIYQYFVLKKRLIKKCPRQIKYADTFVRPTDPVLEQGLSLFEEKIRRGDDVNPHLNKAMANINYQDKMLFDWDIYHFHLGTSMDRDGYHVGRTGDIVYAMVTDDTTYFITLSPHGRWADKDLLDIVASNWESLLEKSRINAQNLSVDYDSEGVKRLRGINVNTILKLSNGKCYASIGGGILGNGGSTEAQMERMGLEQCVKKFEEQWDETVKNEIINECLSKEVPEVVRCDVFPHIQSYILKRVYEDKINVVNVTDGQENILDVYFPIPSLKEIING